MRDPETLLLKIARCSNVEHAMRSVGRHHCDGIVCCQNAESLQGLQVPEPWSGHIESAPILFLSSNPSIDKAEHYPLWSWPDAEIVDFFSNRFEKWIEGGIRHWETTGGFRRKPTRYWIEVRSRASELLGRPTWEIVPGTDYALSEVVHCKSAGEKHVESARRECANLYLRSLVAASAARVIVCLGHHARCALQEVFHRELGGIVDGNEPCAVGPLLAEGSERYIVFLRHPNYRGPRKFENCLPEDLAALRSYLDEHQSLVREHL